MKELASLGLWNLVAPLFWWVPLFVVAAGLLGLSTLRRTRRQLIAAQKPTRLPTALLGIFLLVLLPLGAGFFGGSFSLKRGLGKAIEQGGDQVTEWSIVHGAASLKAALGLHDPPQKLHRYMLHALITSQLAGTAHETRVDGNPLEVARRLPRLLERAFWMAGDSALARLPPEATWDELMAGTRVTLHESLHLLAGQCYQAAQTDLLIVALGLIVGHALALAIMWFLARRRLTVVETI